ncbi:MAG: FtsX-like permease family protein [Steroidobacteraceae bacterium]
MIALAPLDRKLLRDLRRMWLQAVAAGAVLACGVATFIMGVGLEQALQHARDRYYDAQRMADLAVSVVRAPDSVAVQLAALPGVDDVETRVSGIALLDLPGVVEPVSARLVSLPAGRRPRINDLVLLAGRLPAAERDNEVVINEAFAEANALAPGARLPALIYGRRRVLEVVGVASSPEFVFAVPPGELLPEPKRFGVAWMGREGLGRAFDLDGAFNDAVLRMTRGADERGVIASIDAVLERHGGRGAYGRDRMLSARFLQDELSQLRTMATILPPIFLLVAVFLVNVSLSRLVDTERSNIGLLKAFGYGHLTVAAHYLKFALVFSLIGVLLGTALGHWVGDYSAGVYRSVYRLPELEFVAGPGAYVGAIALALGAALLGASRAVLRATRLPPATALAPPAPTSFGRLGGAVERAARGFDAKTRMVVRRIARFPRRAATTVIGIALAMTLLIGAQQIPAALDRILEVNFDLAQRMDVTLAFSKVADDAILRDVARLPGVLEVEPVRAVEVILSAGPRRQRDTIIGVPQGARLSRILDAGTTHVEPRGDGLILAYGLAGKLGVQPGDLVHVEATDGRRAAFDLPVLALVQPYIGAPAFLELEALGRRLGEPGRVNAAYALLDSRQRAAFSTELKQRPAVAGVTFADTSEAATRALFAQGSGFFAFLFLLFAAAMAGGVAFSAARVTLAEQERDLATLRVLGFHRREASYVLLAEIGALLLISLPLGMLLGETLSRWMISRFENDLISFPNVISPRSHGGAVLFVCCAVMGAALAVRRGIDRLDLVGVLKSRD